jgi:paraquat-inducible protein B
MTVKPSVVGAFVVGGIALAVGAVLLFGSLRLFSPTVRAVAYFPGSIGGLAVGAPVTFRGVRVGSVAHVRLQLDMRDMTVEIPVILDLDPAAVSLAHGADGAAIAGLDAMIKAGLRAQLTQQSVVTGQLQVELDLQPNVPGMVVGRRAEGLPEIPTIPSTLQNLREKVEELHLNELVNRANEAMTSVRRLSDQLNGQVGPLSDSILQTAESARTTLGAATEAIRQVQADSTRALGDVDKLAVEARAQLSGRGAELSRVLVDADRTMHEAQALAASLSAMTAPRSEARLNLEAALRDLAAASASLRGFAGELERNPGALVTGRGSR